jgi:hypothetical protein
MQKESLRCQPPTAHLRYPGDEPRRGRAAAWHLPKKVRTRLTSIVCITYSFQSPTTFDVMQIFASPTFRDFGSEGGPGSSRHFLGARNSCDKKLRRFAEADTRSPREHRDPVTDDRRVSGLHRRRARRCLVRADWSDSLGTKVSARTNGSRLTERAGGGLRFTDRHCDSGNRLHRPRGSAERRLQGRCASHPAAVPAPDSRYGSVGLPGPLAT